MKRRLVAIRDVVHSLASRASEAGSSSYLQAKVKEMECQTRGLESENAQLRDDLDAADRRIKELERTVRVLNDRIGTSRSLSSERETQLRRGVRLDLGFLAGISRQWKRESSL